MPPNALPDASTDSYMLGHNLYSAVRLNAQHYTWQQELQFNLHPDVPPPSNGARVADVAARTGAWLLKVARAFPNVQFDGFDITLSQCPAKPCLPSNVDFSVWNMFSEPREEFVGKYDIVHIRLVILVIQTNSELILTLKNLAKLLEPGGYLQWDEMDLTHTVIFPEDGESVKVNGIKKMDTMMKEAPAYKWVPAMPQMMNSNGFENVKHHQIHPRVELMRFNTDTTSLFWIELANRAQDPKKKKVYWEEVQKGGLHATAKAIFVARKAF